MTSLLQETTLNFSSKGQPVNVQKIVGFVNQVEFSDGKIWVPNRQRRDFFSQKLACDLRPGTLIRPPKALSPAPGDRLALSLHNRVFLEQL